MALRIRLTWEDNNSGESGHRVYRSSSPMDPEALPEPLAELPPNATEYVDEDVEENLNYYYRVSVFSEFAEKVSSEIQKAVSFAPDIGAYWADQGGYYAGISSRGYHVIVAPKNTEVVRAWKNSNTDTPGTGSTSSTASELRAAVEAAGLANHPAMAYCAGYTGGGFTDWALPGTPENQIIQNNLGASNTSVPLFQPGGAQAFRNSTTHASAGDWWYWIGVTANATTARLYRPSAPAGLATWPNKTTGDKYVVRPVRIIPAS